MKTPKQTKLNTTEPKRELNDVVRRLFGCELEVATEKQVYRALCTLVREKLTEQNRLFNRDNAAKERKEVYYMSMEFLVGTSLHNNLFNLGIEEQYREALEQAQAALARAKTQASLAQSEANRTDKLVHTNLVSREEWEQRRSAAVQAQADIRAAQAAVDAAQLNLDFTKVTAPIDGRASRALITSGNLVTAGDTASVLTTLVSQKTVYVYFDVDESTYLHYQNLARRGQGASSDNQALPVEIGLVGEEGYPHQGKVDFLDNQLTPSTGTIRMRALLDNSQRLFTPGLFARVRLPGSAEFKATLIDDKAVLTDQDRKYVYIVDKDGKAQRRDITPGRLADGLRIVQKGLNPGDSVIVDGLQKVFMPGMPVNAKTVAMTSSATLN